jgi:hypothetical protein
MTCGIRLVVIGRNGSKYAFAVRGGISSSAASFRIVSRSRQMPATAAAALARSQQFARLFSTILTAAADMLQTAVARRRAADRGAAFEIVRIVWRRFCDVTSSDRRRRYLPADTTPESDRARRRRGAR